jgi:LAO/AO transport system kinase
LITSRKETKSRWARPLAKVEEIAKGVLAGDRRSIAKAITIAENDTAEAKRLIAAIYPHTGKAHIIGLTGPGGSGKSTLIEKIVREYRRRGKTVGVVAVDPTSPFSGGAFLGDRIRMQELSTDEGVFIRSMATRNYPGGIAKATKDAVKILDASGKDVVIVETVGAGQSEVEIIKVAQTIVVIHAPGLGDEIQAIKAGLMEIADIFVVNKADRENADKTAMDIQSIIHLNNKAIAWKPPIIKTIALTGEGVPQLLEKIEEHRLCLEREAGGKRDLEKAEAELSEAIKEKVTTSVIEELKREGEFKKLLQKIMKKEIDPSSAAEKLLHERFKKAE